MNIKKCKIVYLSNRSKGGIASHQAQHINFLNEQSDCVDIFLIDDEPDDTLSRIDRVGSKNVRVIKTSVWSNRGKMRKEISDLTQQGENILLVVNNPSLLIKHAAYFFFLKKFKKVQFLLTLHSGMRFNFSFIRPVGELMVSFLAYLLCNEVVFVSEFTRNYWVDKFIWLKRIPSRVVYNGVNIDFQASPKVPGSPLRVGYVGRFEDDKNPALFAEIACTAHVRQMPFEFHAYGDGPLLSEIYKKNQGLIKFHGWKTPEIAFSQIDILVITSPAENCPYVLLEAKVRGIPAVAGKIGGLPEIITEGLDGVLLEKITAESFLEAVQSISVNYQFFSGNCFKAASNFDARSSSIKFWSPYLSKLNS